MPLRGLIMDSSCLEDRQVELANTLGVGNQINFDDPPAPDRESQHETQSATGGDDDSRGSVNERDLCEPRTSSVGQRPFGEQQRTTQLPRRACRDGVTVGAQHDVGIEYRHKSIEVAVARSSKEGLNNFSLALAIGISNCRSSANAAARSARKLSCGSRRASDDWTDFVEGQVKYVVQHEGDPLGRSQVFEDHKQCKADRVCQQRILFRVTAFAVDGERLWT